jgi:hypothetical protein
MAKHFALISQGTFHKVCLSALEELRAEAWVFAESLQMLEMSDFDGLIVCADRSDADHVVAEFFAAQKPVAIIGAGIALAARVLGSYSVTLARGTGAATAKIHFADCADSDYVSDRENRLISAPSAENPEGVRLAMRELVEIA